MIYYGRGSEREVFSDDTLRAGLSEALGRLGKRLPSREPRLRVAPEQSIPLTKAEILV